MLKDGEGDEALEVGVLRYKQGPGIGKSFLLFFLFFLSLFFFSSWVSLRIVFNQEVVILVVGG